MTEEEAWDFAEDATQSEEWDRLLIACDALQETGEEEAAETLRWYVRKGCGEWVLSKEDWHQFWTLEPTSLFGKHRWTFVGAVDQMGKELRRLREVFGD